MAGSNSWTLRGGVAVLTGAAEATATQARATGVTVSTHAMDVADHAAAAAVLAAHGRVTALVNSAGVALGGLFEQVSAATSTG